MACINWLPGGRRSLPLAAVLLLGLSALAGCTRDRTPELLGAWQAVLLVEEQDTIEVKLDDVGLFFSPEGNYILTSTLDYEENGSFKLDGNYLLTTPSNQDTLQERTVEIAFLDDQNLHINMQEGDKMRRLELERIGLDEQEGAQGLDEPDTYDPGADHDHMHDDHGHDHDH